MLLRLAALFLALTSALFAAEIPLSTPVPTVAPGSARSTPQVAGDGTGGFLVAWIDFRSDSRTAVWAAHVDGDGNLLAAPFRVSSIGTPVFITPGYDLPLVVWSGKTYLVLWNEAPQPFGAFTVRVARVDRDGRLLDALTSNTTRGSWRDGAAAAAGDRILLVASFDATRVIAWLLDERGERITSALLPSGSQGAVASNGRAFLAASLSGDSVAITPVSRDDVVGAARLVPASKVPPAITSNGRDYLVVYVDRDGALVAERVDENGALVARNVLPYRTASSRPITVAPFGSGYVVAVPTLETSPPTVAALRVDEDGRFLGAISVTTNDAAAGAVALAASGGETLAAWPEIPFRTGGPQIFARVVGKAGDGALLSRAAAPQRNVKLATDGDGYLAAWLEARPVSTTTNSSVQVRIGRFTRDGAALDGDGIVVGETVDFYEMDDVAAVFDGRNYLVAWRSTDARAVFYARLAPDGRLLDATPRRLDFAPQGGVALASNGRESLLVVTGSPTFATYAARIRQDGLLAGAPERVSWESSPNSSPSVAWGGSTWLVTWSVVPRADYADADIHAARLSASGVLLDPVAIPIVDTALYEIHPAVASNGADFLVAWADTPGPPWTYTVRARRVGADGTLGELLAFSRGMIASQYFARGASPSVTARGGDYVVAWIDGADLVFAPLSAPSLRLLLATGADTSSTVTLLGAFAAYDRVDIGAGEVPRGFLRTYEIARPRPTGW